MSTRNWALGFYWAGVSLTLGCIALVVADHTGLMAWSVDHTGVPLSWMLAGAAIAAFIVGEFFHRRSDHKDLDQTMTPSRRLESKPWSELEAEEAVLSSVRETAA
jgi:hypothetical protein